MRRMLHSCPIEMVRAVPITAVGVSLRWVSPRHELNGYVYSPSCELGEEGNTVTKMMEMTDGYYELCFLA